MRLDKFIATVKGCSRSDAGTFVKKGRISVNGNIVRKPDIKVFEKEDSICLDNEALNYEEFVYFMLNKPAGTVSAVRDSSPTVIDLFKDVERKGLFPVGRLDKDTTGLIIITDDGKLSHHLTSPRHHVNKTYHVISGKPLSEEDLRLLETPLDIGEGETSAPGVVERISDNEIFLTISEGKYHEVKRMLIAVGNEVAGLKRVSIGSLKLDESLKEGEFRRLSESEINMLFNE